MNRDENVDKKWGNLSTMRLGAGSFEVVECLSGLTEIFVDLLRNTLVVNEFERLRLILFINGGHFHNDQLAR